MILLGTRTRYLPLSRKLEIISLQLKLKSSPKLYSDHTEQLLGELLNHDDSVNDRSVGSKLANSSQITSRLWKESFGEEFRRKGLKVLKTGFIIYLIPERFHVPRITPHRSTSAVIK